MSAPWMVSPSKAETTSAQRPYLLALSTRLDLACPALSIRLDLASVRFPLIG